MSWLAVEQALTNSVDSMGLGYPIIQENDTEERKKDIQGGGEFWIEHFNLPAATEPLDKNLTDQYQGIFQISIYGQQNKGKGGILAILDQVLAFYLTGQEYTENTCTVQVFSSSPEVPRIDGSYYVIDLSVNWGAYIGR